MGILLAFAPFIAFAVVDRLIGPTQVVSGKRYSVACRVMVKSPMEAACFKLSSR